MPDSYLSDEYVARARDALIAGGVIGPHQSHSRRDNLMKIRSLLEGGEDTSFGLSRTTQHSVQEVLSFLSELTGCSSDLSDLEGEDTMDADLCVSAIIAAALRLRSEAERGATLMTFTGHPTGPLEHHIRVVDAYRRAGGKILRLREEERFKLQEGTGQARYVGGVGCLAIGSSLMHTHSAAPMEAVLEAEPWPDLVLADHGFAGAAIERGIPTIAVMDINDPALAVAWGEKKEVMIIPMDDNRPPSHYEPSWRIFEDVLAQAGS